MNEHRKVERKILTTFTPVYDQRKNKLLGYLGDLTLKGAMLIGSTPSEINKKYTLGIDFHKTPEIPATLMTVPARVAWCRHEEHTAFFNTGLEFLELSDENKKVIDAILERYQFRRDMPV